MLVQCIARAHFVTEYPPIELHVAATIKKDVHSTIYLLSVLVEGLTDALEQDTTVLYQILNCGLLEAEQDWMICLNLFDAMLSLSNFVCCHKL